MAGTLQLGVCDRTELHSLRTERGSAQPHIGWSRHDQGNMAGEPSEGDVVFNLSLPPEQAFIVRSLAGHIVAGVATAEEVEAFRRFSDSLS